MSEHLPDSNDLAPQAAQGGSTDRAAAPIIVLVSDLIFASRVSNTAKVLGAEIRLLRDPRRLAECEGCSCIVDLNLAGAITAVQVWRSGGTTGRPRKVVGFVSHTDVLTIQRAREAGVDRVMARSAFVAQLPDLLKSL